MSIYLRPYSSDLKCTIISKNLASLFSFECIPLMYCREIGNQFFYRGIEFAHQIINICCVCHIVCYGTVIFLLQPLCYFLCSISFKLSISQHLLPQYKSFCNIVHVFHWSYLSTCTLISLVLFQCYFISLILFQYLIMPLVLFTYMAWNQDSFPVHKICNSVTVFFYSTGVISVLYYFTNL